MVMIMIIVLVSVLTGRGSDLSTTWLTMIAAAGLAQYDSSPQISG
jgi:low affinity Fe/Cu permease